MKDFFDELNRLARPRRPDIIEKDFHLHRLLGKISDDDYLCRILVMKGGACLIKGYAGYYRFSEDLDFTWNDPERWEGKTSVQIRKGTLWTSVGWNSTTDTPSPVSRRASWRRHGSCLNTTGSTGRAYGIRFSPIPGR